MTVPTVPTWIQPDEGATVDESVVLEWSASTLNGGGGGTLVHEDNFVAAAGTLLAGDNHTPDTGSGYTIITADPAKHDFEVIESGVISLANPGTGDSAVRAGTAIAADVVIRQRMHFIDGNFTNQTPGIWARGTDVDNKLQFIWHGFQEKWAVGRTIGGTAENFFYGELLFTPVADGSVTYELELTLAANGDLLARVHDGTSWNEVANVSADTALATGGALDSGWIGITMPDTGGANDTSGAKITYLSAEE